MSELALSIDDQERKDRYLHRVMEAGNSLLSVINDILDFSKIEASRLTLETIDFDLRRVLDGAMDLHLLAAEEKGLKLRASVAEDVPPALVGDPSRLRQILINLVGNAIKFTETGGVTVSVRPAAPADDLKPGDPITMVFSVADTGVGIPEHKQRDIFQSFLQADDSITRKYGGTGLGLAICQLLVGLMGGELSLESEEGKGSTFTFTTDLKVGDPAAVERERREAETPPPEIAPMTVLLADDNPLNRELATTLLSEQGHRVLAVKNGIEALNALRESPFDLVLMDVQMPIMDGVSATRAIRDPNSGAVNPNIPIVALTAHALKGDRERFLDAGMDDYIAKPIKMRDFYNTIAKVTNSHPQTPPEPREERRVPTPSGKPFDRESALEMLGGKESLLSRMDEIFLRDVPGELEELTVHFSDRDWKNAKRMAHSIKSSARTIGAQRLGAIAEQMEYLCRQQDVASAEKELKILESDVRSALDYLTDIRGKAVDSLPET
jgi:CheY-like chemotaxis protein/HPt (histidine-containing phosphotransfer) domain-containing protein